MLNVCRFISTSIERYYLKHVCVSVGEYVIHQEAYNLVALSAILLPDHYFYIFGEDIKVTIDLVHRLSFFKKGKATLLSIF